MDEYADEFDTDDAPELSDAEPSAAQGEQLPEEVRTHIALQGERIDRLQSQLTRARLEARYGPDLVAKLPEGIDDPTQFEPLLQSLREEADARSAPQSVPEPAGPTPEELRLAAAMTPLPPGTAMGDIGWSREDAMALAVNDPARYQRLKEAGLVSLEKLEDLFRR